MIVHIDTKQVQLPKLDSTGKSVYSDDVYIKEITIKDENEEFSFSANTIEEEKNMINQVVGAMYSCLKTSEPIVSSSEMLESLKNRALLLDCLPKGMSIALLAFIARQSFHLEKFFDYEGELDKEAFLYASNRLL